MPSFAPHRPSHDRWMTHPDDVDYLAPADRWCRVCAQPDRDHVCTTCGRRADDRYENGAAGEACVDRVHDAFYPVRASLRVDLGNGADVVAGSRILARLAQCEGRRI